MKNKKERRKSKYNRFVLTGEGVINVKKLTGEIKPLPENKKLTKENAFTDRLDAFITHPDDVTDVKFFDEPK